MPKQTRSYENGCYQNNASEKNLQKRGDILRTELIEIKQLFFFFFNSSKSDKKQNQRKFMY